MPHFNRTVIFSSVIATIHMAHAADGTLILSTEPKQANVYIDGELKANVTPIYIDVPVGKRQVVVKQVGFKPQELELLIVEKAILNQKVQLEPEKAPIPACDPNQLSLTRDPFETDDEFADRGFEVIGQLNAGATRQDVACQAGVAKLNKAKYDLKTKIFPVEITWQPWTKELKLETKGQIAIPKNQARSLWKEGVEKPVFVLFDQVNATPTVNRMVLLGLGQQWEIKPELKIAVRLPFEPEMVDIPAGSFEMGSGNGDESPIHTVHINAFQMGKYEVTFNEYDAFATATGRALPSDSGWGRGRRPVINVTWDDAVAYTQWLSNETHKNYRLVTEAEWEYACRGGVVNETYCGGDNIDVLGWYGSNSNSQTHEVGGKQPNKFGLYDMSGNVWEWNQDRWHDSYSGAPTDGSAWESGDSNSRLLRGGSWFRDPDSCRSANRSYGTNPSRDYGFRVVAGAVVLAPSS